MRERERERGGGGERHKQSLHLKESFLSSPHITRREILNALTRMITSMYFAICVLYNTFINVSLVKKIMLPI